VYEAHDVLKFIKYFSIKGFVKAFS